MKNHFKVLIFTIYIVFFTSVSYAYTDHEIHYLYVIDHEKEMDLVGKCHVKNTNGELEDCYYDYSILNTRLSSVATRVDGEYVYVAGPEYESKPQLYVCLSDTISGSLYGCATNHDPDIAPKNISRMAGPISSYSYSDLFYITSSTFGSCQFGYLGFQMYSSCDMIKGNLPEPTSIATTFWVAGTTTYVTLRETSSIYACHIRGDRTLDTCNNNELFYINLVSPVAIAISTERPSNYAYIIDNQSSSGLAKSCHLKGYSGTTLEYCKSTKIPNYTSGATSITLSRNNRYAYISFPKKSPGIVKCNIESGTYTNCIGESAAIFFTEPEDIAYR